MTDKCTIHRKDFVANCMWCGRRLCEHCIAYREGKKSYCEKCRAQLSPLRRESIPQAGFFS